MRTAIVYCSQTGYTQKYADWLAEDLGCEAVPYADKTRVVLSEIDLLVFCSWFHAASIIPTCAWSCSPRERRRCRAIRGKPR